MPEDLHLTQAGIYSFFEVKHLNKFGRMVSLKVDNLTYRTTNEDLEYLFEKYGKVVSTFIQN